MHKELPPSWQHVLACEFDKPYFRDLEAFVDAERRSYVVYPPPEQVFCALQMTLLDQVKVVLLGQDPYHGQNQAHGLCFSVQPGTKPPRSLMNIFKELQTDLGCSMPKRGCLLPWAERGVLLLNAVLTVRAGEAASHGGRGWEQFTDAVLRAVSERQQPAVFALWGNYAHKKEKLVDARRHRVVKTAHPSPLSAGKFLGSRPFSAINNALGELGQPPIDWQLP
jgi:uracil-DNA glycosylase